MVKVLVKVKTNAKAECVTEEADGRLLVSTKALPIGGKANRSVQKILSKHFAIASKNIRLLKGETSQFKTFEIDFPE